MLGRPFRIKNYYPMTKTSGYDNVAPNASSMIESMRAYGYSVSAAVADLIDNSITANAKNVWLTFHWAGSESWARITDDGDGMNEEELREAMRLGSMSPLSKRSAGDLGRFGLGLKTASFSQCRRLTVMSKTAKDPTAVRRWDLDYLASNQSAEWKLLTTGHEGSRSRLVFHDSIGRGTVVLWEVMDRIVGEADAENADDKAHFLDVLAELERNLGMLFHRFLSGKRPRLRIFLNKQLVSAWDPFLENHSATQPFPVDPVKVGKHGTITVRGYVLPHKDKLGDEQHAAASGPAGWNAQQGFYVYRNDRLIVPGSWLGLGPGRGWTKEEHYKLARIALDLPNTMDHLWQLDVKKSSAVPPAIIKARLRQLAKAVRDKAREVFAHRGKYGRRGARAEPDRPWRTSGPQRYEIDRNHPLVTAFAADLDKEEKAEFEALLKVLQETVPVEQIWIDQADNPDTAKQPFSGYQTGAITNVIRISYNAVRRNRGLTHLQAIELLRSQEEFSGTEAQAILQSMKEQP
jgi:hypothetical protein